MRRIIVCLSLLFLTAPLYAEFPVGKFGLRVSPDMSVSQAGVDGDGNGLGFHLEAGSSALFGYADIQRSSLEFGAADTDFDETRLGGGMRLEEQRGSLAARVERYDLSLESANARYDDDGLAVYVGGEFQATAGVELFADIGSLSLDDNDGREFELGVRRRMAQTSEVFLSFRRLTLEQDVSGNEFDVDGVRLGLNFVF